MLKNSHAQGKDWNKILNLLISTASGWWACGLMIWFLYTSQFPTCFQGVWVTLKREFFQIKTFLLWIITPNNYFWKSSSGVTFCPLLGSGCFSDVHHILGEQPGGRKGAAGESHWGYPVGNPRCGAARSFYMQTWNSRCRPWSTV